MHHACMRIRAHFCRVSANLNCLVQISKGCSSSHPLANLRNTSLLGLFAVLLFGMNSALGAPAMAQVAHFVGAQKTITSDLYFPWGLAVDGSGAIYIADESNFRVLKETPTASGYVESVFMDAATSGASYFLPYGVAVDGSGDVFVLNGGTGQLIKEARNGSGYTRSDIVLPAVGGPTAIAADRKGDVFVSFIYSKGNLVKLTPVSGGGYLQSLVGSGLGLFELAVAVDWSGNVYTVDSLSDSVIKETPSGRGYRQSTIFSGSIGAYGLTVDAWGGVYVFDSTGVQLWKPTTSGYSKTEVAVPGLTEPQALAVDSLGTLYVTDSGHNRVIAQNPLGGYFGRVEVGTTSPTPISAVFTFDKADTLGAISVETVGGGAGPEFVGAGTGSCTALTAYAAGESCTVDVLFEPKLPGLRFGAAQIVNGSGKTLATGYVAGQGVR
jgi:sugar lactone lactonase YvrE